MQQHSSVVLLLAGGRCGGCGKRRHKLCVEEGVQICRVLRAGDAAECTAQSGVATRSACAALDAAFAFDTSADCQVDGGQARHRHQRLVGALRRSGGRFSA